MGVQFGICNCDGEPVDNDFLERVERSSGSLCAGRHLRSPSRIVLRSSTDPSNGVHSEPTTTLSPANSRLDDVGWPAR